MDTSNVTVGAVMQKLILVARLLQDQVQALVHCRLMAMLNHLSGQRLHAPSSLDD